MPEILPVSVPMPAAPAPVAGVAPAAPVVKDASAADFMGQLASALKGLKGIAAVVKNHTGQQPEQSADATASDPDPAAPEGAKTAAPTDDVTELMATLGLVLVPTQPATAPADAAPGSAAPIGTKVPRQLLPELPQAPVKDPSPAEADAARAFAEKLPQPHDTHELPQHVAAQLPKTDASTVEAPQAAAIADAKPAAPQPAQPQPSAPATPHAVQAQPQAQLQPDGDAFQQSTGNGAHHGDHGSSRTESAASTEAAHTSATVQPTFVDPTSATTTAAPVENAAPATPQAVDVAAQIAHQVDLYKLPGSKGVRIQLHPEDLGGVQVTVKYGNGGNLELHVNVEHAATGTLVQDGLNHLRDALATHGFEPDRIVMSITAPSGANQMDFNANSNGSGSYRSDPGMTAFTQDGQSGQQGSEQDEARWSRGGWSSTTDADDSPRAASQSASGTSVIDYRV